MDAISGTITLFAGGNCGSSCRQALVAGGIGDCTRVNGANDCQLFHPVRFAELYDPATDRWATVSAMRSPRSDATATLLTDGTVLVTGGWGVWEQPSATTAEIYRANATQPALALTSVDPRVGPTLGTEVTLTGVGMFSPKTSVRVGDLELADPLPGAELYTPAPLVNALLPGGGPEGIQVVITGANFAPGIGAGPVSKPASVTLASTGVCKAIEAAAGQVVYGGGRYHLVGGPDGTVVRSDSPLYSWSDQGAGGTYAAGAGGAALASGRGYWSYSRCDRAVSPAGEGTDRVSFDLGAYHASMVANPSGTGPASLTGHDFSARWDPDLNAGAGGYHISAYREPQSLAVGEGIWAFSFVPTTLSISR
ncbi:MAG TPA: hypothetical protein VM142_13615 [Acidimicrobiales bacterium]|nr:hypothetical protein [Acidimicrobiales bacterium]